MSEKKKQRPSKEKTADLSLDAVAANPLVKDARADSTSTQPTSSSSSSTTKRKKKKKHKSSSSTPQVITIGDSGGSSKPRKKRRERPTVESVQRQIRRLKEDMPSSAQSLNDVSAILTQISEGGSRTATESKKWPLENYDAEKIALIQRAVRRWIGSRKLSVDALIVKERMLIWDTFIGSEKNFFLKLMTLVAKYLRPLKNNQIVNDEALKDLFGCIESIKEMSKQLLSRLRDTTHGEWVPSTTIGHIFMNDILPGLKKNYVSYLIEYPKRVSTLSKLVRKNPEFKEFLDRMDSAAGTQSLSSLMLEPLSRLTAYEWSLQELSRLTPEDHAVSKDMQRAALGAVKLNMTLTVHKNAAIRAQKLNDAQMLSGEFMDVLTMDRQFVREGPISVVDVAGMKNMMLYLFSDVLAIGVPLTSAIEFEDSIILKTCELNDNQEMATIPFLFEVKGKTGNTNKILRLSCKTLEEKKSWMNDINMAINKQISTKQLAIATDGAKLSDADLVEVAKRMVHPASGVPVKARKRRMQTFENSFVGTDAVDWLVRNYNLPRLAAVELGNRMLRANYFHHVTYNHPFEDKKELFEFQELGEGDAKVPTLNYSEFVKQVFHPQQGVPLGAKKGRFGLKKKNVFHGNDLIDWISKHLKVLRNVAVTIGQNLMDQDFFTGANLDVMADDKMYLYQVKSSTVDNLSFPTERVLGALKDLKNNPAFKGSGEDLDYVIRMLTNGDSLYVSNIQSILDDDDEMDQITKGLVLSYAGDAGVVRQRGMERSYTLSTSLTMSSGSNEFRTPLINALVAQADQWDFPIFRLAEESNGMALHNMGYALFLFHDLIAKFNIEEKKLNNFLIRMNNGYQANLYHNSTHAADVSQTLNFFLTKGGPLKKKALTDTDVFAAVIASIIHDYDHPGVNNAFMVQSKHEIAIRYNDASVLENHHSASAFFVLQEEECDIFSNCPPEVYKEVRETVIKMVLATDFAKHFDILGQFKGKIASGGFDFDKIEDRRLLLQVGLKCADISHTSKGIETHKNWTGRVTEEFYLQGDREASENLEISPHMVRAKGNLPKSQMGFIGFLALPLFETWCEHFEDSIEALDGVQSNLAYWKSEDEKQGAT